MALPAGRASDQGHARNSLIAAFKSDRLAPDDAARITRALSDASGMAGQCIAHAGFTWWSDSEDRRQPHGPQPALLFGRIDNRDDIAARLRLAASTSDGVLYAHALDRWGDDADNRLVGHYCAISEWSGKGLRLVRSPWTAPPLHFVETTRAVGASPLLKAIFAAGHAPTIDYDYLIDQLVFDHHDCAPYGYFAGVGRVPLGTRVFIGDGDVRLDRFYDPLATPRVRFTRDEDYVDRARELLDEAAAKAMAGLKRPGMMLSGGLDSPLAAVSALRSLPEPKTLPTFTFGPVDTWDGIVPLHLMGEERQLVAEFAALHPRIEPHFPDPCHGGHDYLLRELLAKCSAPTANIANVGIFHGPFIAAKAAGCDGMLTAMLGNFTISEAAAWASPEFFRQGKWRALWQMLGGRRPIDRRSRLRMVLAMGVLPNLPTALQDMIRSRGMSHTSGMSLLTPAALAQQARRRGARAATAPTPSIPRNRQQAIRAMWASADSGEDADLSFELLYAMPVRDITAYRPLIEFCHGLPTDQFVRGDEDRWLARRMARGIMPETQRLNRRMGRHNVDWHTRLGERRAEITAFAEAMRAHPVLGEVIDIDRMQRLLADWPETTPWAFDELAPRYFGITRTLTAAHFVSMTERRNDF